MTVNRSQTSSEMWRAWAGRWWEMQGRLAELSGASSHILVPGSGHFMQRDAPDAVIAAIRQVMEATRRH